MLDYIINYESIKNNLYVRNLKIDKSFESNLKNGIINYNQAATWIPESSSDKDSEINAIYDANYSRSAHAIRWISAVPMALWDVTVCTIARVALFFLMERGGDGKQAHVQFYHIGKNFQMAAGRLYGMLWGCDKEGMKIVHAAALNKRLYTVKFYADTTIVHNAQLVCEQLCKFYAETLWNKVNVKVTNSIEVSEEAFIELFKKRLSKFNDENEYDKTHEARTSRFNPSYERLNMIFNELASKAKQTTVVSEYENVD